MVMASSPSRSGLLNLVAELETRLGAGAQEEVLLPGLAALIPEAASYLLIVFDGLGDVQLLHPAATGLAASRRGRLYAPFPTTTTVSLATICSGQAVSTHGWLGHLMWVPDLNRVVNTLKWVDLQGKPVIYDTSGLLPYPNLWERLGWAGIDSVTVQPADFASTPLTAALYRGCRFAGYQSPEEFVGRCIAEAATPGRLVMGYWPSVDYAGHVYGLESAEYTQALIQAASVWDMLTQALPSTVAMIGTADHGMIAVTPERKHLIRHSDFQMLDFFGDPRAVMMRGSERLIRRVQEETGAERLPDRRLQELWDGHSPHPQLSARRPAAVLLAPPDEILLPPGFDKRLVGYHGGMSEAEVAIPLLVAR